MTFFKHVNVLRNILVNIVIFSAPARTSKGQGAGAKRAQCQNEMGTLPRNGISAYPLSHNTNKLVWAVGHKHILLPFLKETV